MILRRVPGSRRQRGFSLIIVFILVIAMVGIAAALMVSTQGDLQVAGQDRESATAFYAAEAGIAFAKDWLTSANMGQGNATWSTLLASGVPQLCVVGNGQTPGTVPQTAQVPYDLIRPASYRFCFHNNVDDPNYTLNPPTGDTVDGDGVLAIESYGYGPNGSVGHVTVNVAVTAGAAATNCYAGSGGGGCNSFKAGNNAQGGTINNFNSIATIGSGG